MSALRRALRDLPAPVFVDLLESDESYLLVVDLPGVTEDGLDLEVVDETISVTATRERSVPEEFEYRDEGREPVLDAEFPIPEDATGAEAEATLDRGVLELILPKTDGAPETVIPIEGR